MRSPRDGARFDPSNLAVAGLYLLASVALVSWLCPDLRPPAFLLWLAWLGFNLALLALLVAYNVSSTVYQVFQSGPLPPALEGFISTP